jgi:hypothetical protein
MEFITTDGKIEIKDNKIIQKRLTNDRRQRILVSFYFFLFFINLFIKELDKLNIDGKQSAWIGIVLYAIPIMAYIFFVGHFLLRQILINKLEISKISEVKLEDTEIGLEKYLLIKTDSKRYKLFKFRRLENEYTRLIQHLTSLNPAIKIIAD